MLVVDDHEVVHWGFRLLLGEQPWVERCLTARNGDEALELARRYEPARRARRPVPGRRVGRRALRAIRARLAAHARAADLGRRADLAGNAARAAGASGFVSKDWDAADVAEAVRMVGIGHDRVPPARASQRRPAR